MFPKVTHKLNENLIGVFSIRNCYRRTVFQHFSAKRASIGSSSRIRIPEKAQVHKSILKLANHVSLDGSFQDFWLFRPTHIVPAVGYWPTSCSQPDFELTDETFDRKTPNSSLGPVMYSVHARPFRCALHVVAVVIHVRPSVRPWCPRSFYRHQGRGSTRPLVHFCSSRKTDRTCTISHRLCRTVWSTVCSTSRMSSPITSFPCPSCIARRVTDWFPTRSVIYLVVPAL